MAITLRTTKGSELTHAELDANFTTLEAADAALAATDATLAAADVTLAAADAAHAALTVAHGVTGAVVGTTDAQALTNKTIVVASNTVTTASSGNLAATELNAALSELQSDIDTRATSAALTAHIDDTTAAHAASAISYAGNTNLSSTTVEAALDELDNEKQPLDATLTAISDETMGAFGHRNKIIGGDFTTNPWQRGTSFTSVTTPANSDDTYLVDRWYLLSDGNDIVDVTRAAGPTGTLYSLAMDVETANKKFGIAQIIESANAVPLIGGTCSLSFKAKVTGTSLTTIKAGVVAWSGTADTVTSDIISAWNADGVTPTLIANATFENTPADLNVTTDWATYKIEGISVDTASTTNMIVFIWCDNATTTVADFLYVDNVQLEEGSVATPFEHRQIGTELDLCQRYYETGTFFHVGYVSGAINLGSSVKFSTTKRVAPTITQTNTSTVNCGSTPNNADVAIDSFLSFRTGTAAGAAQFSETWTASAEL